MAERIFIEPRTIAEALREAARKLAATSDTERLDAELLMAHVLGLPRSEMLLRRMRSVPPDGYDALIARRAMHEPVAYITGTQEFYGLELAVTRDVLIPRGDSEALIETARKALADRPPANILDLGTGSGALLLAAMSLWPDAKGMGVDCSSHALVVAIGNAETTGINKGLDPAEVAKITKRLKASGVDIATSGFGAIPTRARFIERDWRKPDWAEGLGPFDLILCNPPYVEFDADLSRDVRDFEPAGALFSGDEGLNDYRILVPQLAGLLTENGIAVLEIGATQDEAVTALARASGFTVQLHHDLASRPRALLLARHQ